MAFQFIDTIVGALLGGVLGKKLQTDTHKGTLGFQVVEYANQRQSKINLRLEPLYPVFLQVEDIKKSSADLAQMLGYTTDDVLAAALSKDGTDIGAQVGTDGKNENLVRLNNLTRPYVNKAQYVLDKVKLYEDLLRNKDEKGKSRFEKLPANLKERLKPNEQEIKAFRAITGETTNIDLGDNVIALQNDTQSMVFTTNMWEFKRGNLYGPEALSKELKEPGSASDKLTAMSYLFKLDPNVSKKLSGNFLDVVKNTEFYRECNPEERAKLIDHITVGGLDKKDFSGAMELMMMEDKSAMTKTFQSAVNYAGYLATQFAGESEFTAYSQMVGRWMYGIFEQESVRAADAWKAGLDNNASDLDREIPIGRDILFARNADDLRGTVSKTVSYFSAIDYFLDERVNAHGKLTFDNEYEVFQKLRDQPEYNEVIKPLVESNDKRREQLADLMVELNKSKLRDYEVEALTKHRNELEKKYFEERKEILELKTELVKQYDLAPTKADITHYFAVAAPSYTGQTIMHVRDFGLTGSSAKIMLQMAITSPGATLPQSLHELEDGNLCGKDANHPVVMVDNHTALQRCGISESMTGTGNTNLFETMRGEGKFVILNATHQNIPYFRDVIIKGDRAKTDPEYTPPKWRQQFGVMEASKAQQSSKDRPQNAAEGITAATTLQPVRAAAEKLKSAFQPEENTANNKVAGSMENAARRTKVSMEATDNPFKKAGLWVKEQAINATKFLWNNKFVIDGGATLMIAFPATIPFVAAAGAATGGAIASYKILKPLPKVGEFIGSIQGSPVAKWVGKMGGRLVGFGVGAGLTIGAGSTTYNYTKNPVKEFDDTESQKFKQTEWVTGSATQDVGVEVGKYANEKQNLNGKTILAQPGDSIKIPMGSELYFRESANRDGSISRQMVGAKSPEGTSIELKTVRDIKPIPLTDITLLSKEKNITYEAAVNSMQK